MRYYAKIIYDKEEQSYSVSFPDFKNIFTFGSSKEEAINNAHEALNINIEELVDSNMEIPKPKIRKGAKFLPIEVEPNNIIAYKLKKLRGKKKMSEIADKLGIKYQTYQRYENPKTCNPTIKTLKKIAMVFKMEVQYFLI